MRRTRHLPLAAIGALSISLTFAPANVSASDRQTLEQLRDIQLAAIQVSEHAATVSAMTQKPGTYDLDAHEYELTRIKHRINDMGELIPRLQDQAEAPSWQKEIVDEVSSLVAAMSAQTDAAIERLNQATSAVELNSNAYEARITGVRHYAEHVDELVELADTRTESTREEERAAHTGSPSS